MIPIRVLCVFIVLSHDNSLLSECFSRNDMHTGIQWTVLEREICSSRVDVTNPTYNGPKI